MEDIQHKLFDIRQRKPRIIVDKSQNLTYTLMLKKDIKCGNAQIDVWPPNLPGIFIKIARENLDKAKRIYLSFIEPMESKNGTIQLSNEDTVLFYDFIESMQLSIILVCTAVESIVNSIIPSDYIYEIKGKNKINKLNYFEIQKSIGHLKKLDCVLLKACNINVVNTEFWENYKDLYLLRNNLIHMKSSNTSTVYDQRMYSRELENNIIEQQ